MGRCFAERSGEGVDLECLGGTFQKQAGDQAGLRLYGDLQLYTVTLAIADNREGRVVSQFFSAFRSNFRQATLSWLALMFYLFVLLIFYHLILSTDEAMHFALAAVLIFLCIIFICVFVMVFPLIARFQNSFFATMRNAVALGLANPVQTIMMTAVSAAPIMFFAGGKDFVLRGYVLWLLFAFSGTAQMNAYILKRIFRKHTENQKR